MQIADYISQVGDFTEETTLHFEKKLHSPQTGMNPLSCFAKQNGIWTRQEIPNGINRMRMGKNPYECEFKLNDADADDVHVIIQRTGASWFIMEYGRKDLMRVNGFTKRQVHLKQNCTAVVQIGDSQFIFTTHKMSNRTSVTEPNPPVELVESQYSLSYDNNNKNFNLDQMCLIGSDPLCDFFLPGEAFAAMISNLGRRLFMTSLVENVIVEADGVSGSEKAPLRPGSKINIGQSEIIFKLSRDLRFTQNFNFVPDGKCECMRLLEIDNQGHAGHSYVLPPSGRSITIGRDSSSCLLGIHNSAKISRIHANAIIYDKSVMIIDNETTNGTFVNNKRIKKRLVHPGDIVRLGDLNFILCYVG